MGCQIKLWSIHGNKEVPESLGSNVPNLMKDVPNFVNDIPNFIKDVPNFVNDVPKGSKFVLKWGTTPNHIVRLSKGINGP